MLKKRELPTGNSLILHRGSGGFVTAIRFFRSCEIERNRKVINVFYKKYVFN